MLQRAIAKESNPNRMNSEQNGEDEDDEEMEEP
jgi:hypothetical protein